MSPILNLVSKPYFEDDETQIEEDEVRQPTGGFVRRRLSPVANYRVTPEHTIEDWAKYKPSSSAFEAEIQIGSVLAKAATEARELLSLSDDWDGEGALKIQQQTVDRALMILRGALEAVDFGSLPQLLKPDITPLSNGSVDVYWKSDTFTLLINVPAGDSDTAEFYGSNLGTGYDLRGRIHMDGPNLRFLDWLVE
jgi:hypothetical protein